MENYANLWKDEVNFSQIPYDDFVTDFYDVTNIAFMEKVDGFLGMVIFDKGRIFIQTTSGKKIEDLPILAEYQALFKKLGIKEAMIAGELVARKGGVILPFNIIQSVVKKSYVPANKDIIFHYAYDVYSLNNKKPSFKDAINFLLRNIKSFGHITTPEMVFGDISDFRKLFQKVKDKPGFDGVVSRGIKGKNYKVKFSNTIDLVIIGSGNKDMKAWEKDQISYLLTSFIDKDGNFRSSSKVGTGFTDAERASFFKYINQNKLYEKNGEIFVKPKMIIEVKFFRYLQTTTPTYSFKKDRYDLLRKDKSVTFSFPTFIRIRPDKNPNKNDVRLEQIPDWSY